MTKQEFLSELQNALSGLPQHDIQERLTFYSEMIDDRMEEGLTEEEAVSQIGNVSEIVSQIVAEIPLSNLVKEKVRPKRILRAGEIVLLALGAPIWLSLLIAVLAVILAVYAVVWSVIVSMWAVETALAACSLSGIVSAVFFAVQGNGPQALAMLGAGIFCAGLSIFLFFGCKAATDGVLLLTKNIVLGIKSLLIRKENQK